MQTIPSISVEALAEKIANDDSFILLDVREQNEWDVVNFGDRATLLPLSDIGEKQQAVLEGDLANKAQPIVVHCHHGGRSGQVVMWLKHLGYENVWNLDGGIHAYAIEIDSSMPRY